MFIGFNLFYHLIQALTHLNFLCQSIQGATQDVFEDQLFMPVWRHLYSSKLIVMFFLKLILLRTGIIDIT